MRIPALILISIAALIACSSTEGATSTDLPQFAQRTISLLRDGKIQELREADAEYVEQIKAMKTSEPEFRWVRAKELLDQQFTLDPYARLAELLPFEPQIRLLESRPALIFNQKTYQSDIKGQEVYLELQFQDKPELSPIIPAFRNDSSPTWRTDLMLLKRRVVVLAYTADRKLFISSRVLNDEDQQRELSTPYIMAVIFRNQGVDIRVAGGTQGFDGEVVVDSLRLPVGRHDGSLRAKWTPQIQSQIAGLMERDSTQLRIQLTLQEKVVDSIICHGGDGTGGTYTQFYRYPAVISRPFGEDWLRNSGIAYDRRIPMKSCEVIVAP